MKNNFIISRLQEMSPRVRNIANVFVSALIATLVLFLSYKTIIAGANQQFEQDSVLIKNNISALVKRYEQALYSINSFVVSNNELTKKQFDKYLDTLKISEDYPSLDYVHFAQVVNLDDIDLFYEDLKHDYAQAGILTSKLSNQIDLYKNNVDYGQSIHYAVRYARGPQASRFIGMEVPKGAYKYFSGIKVGDSILKSDNYTSIRDDDYKGALVAINLPSYKEVEPNHISFVGSTGAIIKLNDAFFASVKNNMDYVNFQIHSDVNRLYTSEKNQPKMFSHHYSFSATNDFMIGQNKYSVHTFSSQFPPNIVNPDLAYLFTFISFLSTLLIINFAVFKKLDQKKFSRHVTRQVSTLSTQANTDALTGLFNRRYFFNDLHTKIALKPKNRMFLFFIDLDGFKNVNDNLGHSAGDELLQAYTERLQSIDKIKSFTVYRIGGDEFLLLVEQAHYTRALGESDIKDFAESILKLTDSSFIIKEENCTISQSIGIAEYPGDGVTPEELFKNSDMAMYEAKKSGKNCYILYSDELSARNQAKKYMLSLLIKAVEKDGFRLEFQPKMEKINGTYKIHGAEALMRWKPEQLGNVSPAVFIPLAEEAGLMTKIDSWLIHEVGRSFQKWVSQGVLDMVLSINVSARQFSNDSLPDFFKSVLEYYHVKPQNIIIEITESATMKEPEKARKILEKFRDYGFGVSIDDFGTGYSSISYLRQFPATEIKIDKSFTDDIMIDEHDRIIIEGISGMSRKLKLDVVVEGVETQDQVSWIEQAMGGAIIQGYFFSRPLGVDDFIGFANKNTHKNTP